MACFIIVVVSYIVKPVAGADTECDFRRGAFWRGSLWLFSYFRSPPPNSSIIKSVAGADTECDFGTVRFGGVHYCFFFRCFVLFPECLRNRDGGSGRGMRFRHCAFWSGSLSFFFCFFDFRFSLKFFHHRAGGGNGHGM